MAPIGGEALEDLWLLSSGSIFSGLGVCYILLLLLMSIFLTSLCSDCERRSFDLREPEVEKTPSALVKVAKLDESTSTSARENPMIDDIKNDELESRVPVQSTEGEGDAWFTPWRNHLGTHTQPEIDVALAGNEQGAGHSRAANQLDRLRSMSDPSAPGRRPEEEVEQPVPAPLHPYNGWEG